MADKTLPGAGRLPHPADAIAGARGADLPASSRPFPAPAAAPIARLGDPAPGDRRKLAAIGAPSRVSRSPSAAGDPGADLPGADREARHLDAPSPRASSAAICPAPAAIGRGRRTPSGAGKSLAAGKTPGDLPASMSAPVTAAAAPGKLAGDLPGAPRETAAHEVARTSAAGKLAADLPGRCPAEIAAEIAAGKTAPDLPAAGAGLRGDEVTPGAGRPDLPAAGAPDENPSIGGSSAEPLDRGIDPRGVPRPSDRPASLDRGTPIEGSEGWMDAPENLSFWWRISEIWARAETLLMRPDAAARAIFAGPEGGRALLRISAFGGADRRALVCPWSRALRPVAGASRFDPPSL